VYDNGELYCDEHLAKLITYTDSHNEFMEFCFDLWKNKTNKKIYPNCIIMASDDRNIMSERRAYRDYEPKNYLVE
jgi:RNA recognition motif-containing protein